MFLNPGDAMWVGHEFPGDDNAVLKDIQFKNYSVVPLYRASERRYSAAINLLSVATDLWEQMKRHDETYYSTDLRDSFPAIDGELIRLIDHRVLQSAHDTIAAAFRFRNKDLWLPLFQNDEAMKAVAESAWLTFWSSEVGRLAANDEITRAVLTAVAFQNTEKGYAAEKELDGLLRSEYRDVVPQRQRDREVESK